MGIHKQLRILICPLDWGMGHTTRCLPLIHHIQQAGHTVIFAGNQWQRDYINKTSAGIETVHCEGYNVHYGKGNHGFMFSLFLQFPKLLKTIKHENKWLAGIVQQYRIDGVISDNRYGLYHTAIPTAFMTHQVLAQTGMGSIADNLLRRIHFRRIEKFNRCWIVDVAGTPNLSGKLGHPAVLPRNATYIGLLSQIEPAKTTEEHLLILLSGPEPQRTILSDILWAQLENNKGKVVFVEGSNNAARNNIPDHIEYHTRITKEVLQPVLEKAALVICRSGYSTLMDLAVLGKKAILVPTPGQTEQEYLGKYLNKAGVFYSVSQKGFSLEKVLEVVKTFPFKRPDMGNGYAHYKEVLDNWLQNI